MLSFRDGFRRLRQKKQGTLDPKEVEIEHIQRKIFEYFEKKDFENFFEERMLVFSSIESTIFVRSVEDELKKIVCVRRVSGNSRDAQLVLSFLKQKFKNEGYVVQAYKCAFDACSENDQGFLVIINLNE